MEFSGTISSKLPRVKTTIFSVMSALAQETGAVNLSQGFPDFPMDSGLIDAMAEAARNGHNQYAPMPGYFPLREAIAKMKSELYSCAYNPETEITITAGGTQAIFTAITAFIREGDEVMIFEPAYDCYVPAIALAGGVPKFVQLEGPDYSVPWASVKKLLNQRTRMIILNSPHNPTGALLSAQDMEQLEKMIKGKDILVLSDEVYAHLLYDGLEHQSVCRFPELAKKAMVVGSFGKTYHCTGWKVGYLAAPEALTEAFRKVHQYNVFSVNTPAQVAFASFLNRPETYLHLAEFYGRKRDLFFSLMKGLPFKFKPVQGGYFALAKYGHFSDASDVDFAKTLTREAGVATIPLSPFYTQGKDEHYLRFCFAKTDDTLQAAANRLKDWARKQSL